MRTRILRIVTALGLLPALFFSVTGCGGGGSADAVPALDLVALSNRNDAVLIFRDITHKGFGDVADVVLPHTGSGVDRPTGAFVDGDRLFVSNHDAHTVTAYDGFAALASGASPSLTLPVSAPNRLVVAGGDLYVCSQSGYIHVWRDIATVANGDPADLELYHGANAKDLLVDADSLYVAGYSLDRVLVYRNVSTLVADNGPDVVLDLVGSLVHQPLRLASHAGTLYVSNRYNSLLLFRSAASLVNGQAPDVVLGGPSQLEGVRRPVMDTRRLYVPNLWVDDDEPALTIFDDPATLVDGNPPDAMIGNAMQEANAIDLMDDVLAVGDRYDDGVIHVWLHASRMRTDQDADVQLWDPRMTNEGIPEVLLVRR